MENNKKPSRTGPVCLTIMAVCNFAAGILSIPSGLGVFMLITSAICTLGAMLSWRGYLRQTVLMASKTNSTENVRT
jgi:hypothetical protein